MLAAEKIHDEGPDIIIIKLGSDGAFLSNKISSYFIPVFPVERVIDPTGAGDSFAGGLIGCLAKSNNLDFINAVITGSALASFTVEGFGISKLLGVSIKTLNQRIDFIKNKMEIK